MFFLFLFQKLIGVVRNNCKDILLVQTTKFLVKFPLEHLNSYNTKRNVNLTTKTKTTNI